MKEEFNFKEFEKSSYSDWLSKIQKDLGIEKSDKIQKWYPERGLSVAAYHDSESIRTSKFPLNSKRGNTWQYIQPLEKETNSEILEALMNGAGGFIIDATKDFCYQVLLKDVLTEHCHIFILFNELDELKELVDWYQKNSQEKTSRGLTVLRKSSELTSYAPLLKSLSDSEHLRGHKFLELDGHNVVDKGGSVKTEIAFLLTKCVAIINHERDRGASIEEIADAMFVNTAIGSSYFLELVKINVIRQLIRKVFETYGLQGVEVKIHANTSNITKSAIDSNTNFLRCTSEAMSAVIGGADTLSIRSEHDLDFANRVARNISNLLNEESHLGKVGGTAAGSYYLEQLSRDLAEAAWNEFKSISAQGGLNAAIESGYFSNEIEQDLAFRLKQIELGKTKLVGVNDFGNQEEQLAPEDFDFSRQSLSVEFERIRHAVEEFVSKKGEMNRPTVYLLAIGDNGKMINARQSFVSNFFSWAGFKINSSFQKSSSLNSTSLIVWCGSDESYGLLTNARIEHDLSHDCMQIVAGKLGNSHAVGIHDQINMKSNRLRVVGDVLAEMNIKVSNNE